MRRLQLLCLSLDLHFISWTLENHQIMSIQTHCSRRFTLLKQILSDIHGTRISLVFFSSEPQFDFFFILVSRGRICNPGNASAAMLYAADAALLAAKLDGADQR